MILIPLNFLTVSRIIPAIPTEISSQNTEASSYSLRNVTRSLAGFAPLTAPALWEQQTTDPVIFPLELLDRGAPWFFGRDDPPWGRFPDARPPCEKNASLRTRHAGAGNFKNRHAGIGIR